MDTTTRAIAKLSLAPAPLPLTRRGLERLEDYINRHGAQDTLLGHSCVLVTIRGQEHCVENYGDARALLGL